MTQLAMPVPAVRARMLAELARTTQVLAEAVAERTGRDPSDFAVRTLAGAVVGVAMAAYFGEADGFMALDDQTQLATFADKLQRGLGLLEAGLPLYQPEPENGISPHALPAGLGVRGCREPWRAPDQEWPGWLWIRRFCMIHSHPGHDTLYSAPKDLISSYSASDSS